MLDLVALPKSELHLHLEGPIPPSSLLALLRKYQAPDCQNLEALRARLVYRDFDHFLETWWWMTQSARAWSARWGPCACAERIGHGTRAVEDAELVRRLVSEGIPLEVCPTSNVCTGVVPSLQAHAVRALFDAGVRVTLASDDPSFFGA